MQLHQYTHIRRRDEQLQRENFKTKKNVETPHEQSKVVVLRNQISRRFFNIFEPVHSQYVHKDFQTPTIINQTEDVTRNNLIKEFLGSYRCIRKLNQCKAILKRDATTKLQLCAMRLRCNSSELFHYIRKTMVIFCKVHQTFAKQFIKLKNCIFRSTHSASEGNNLNKVLSLQCCTFVERGPPLKSSPTPTCHTLTSELNKHHSSSTAVKQIFSKSEKKGSEQRKKSVISVINNALFLLPASSLQRKI
ncbi:CLUMA_CG007931, isoform A [Clunio marinus]|uniref:CLUMA_CG007931, isoform A n=1 Tax=Clunio marinus TaxID=568069 RepID=A0A1J1I282_9DIPT|nr:CLUMA_CG007931, isoform A [Clunio marinus]